jgi:hypothetical protein
LAERDGKSKVARLIGGDLVMAATQVLHKGVAGGKYPQPGHGLDPATGPAWDVEISFTPAPQD